MTSGRSFLAGLASVWAFLAAFLASLAWFVWVQTQQTSSSCGNGPDYVLSAALTFVLIVALTVVRGRRRRELNVWVLLGQVVATAAWTALGLSVAVFFAAAIGCSA